MAAPNLDGRDRSSRLGYAGAIILSALGHAVFFALVLVILPAYFRHPDTTPPGYTVKIVDNIPAGDLGTHLPRLTQDQPHPEHRTEQPKPAVEQHKTAATADRARQRQDRNRAQHGLHPDADAHSRADAGADAEPTAETNAGAHARADACADAETDSAAPADHTSRLRGRRPRRAIAVRCRRRLPFPGAARIRGPSANEVVIARAEPTPSVKEQLAALRESLLKEHLAERAAAEKARSSGPSGGGPVVASVPREGEGYGVGTGKGSMGIQQDPQFLLYYQMVQDRIKKAWNYVGGSGDLTTSVTFAIGPDGSLTGVKLTQSSRDPAFDDSVIRAIRRAAPFPPPPEKYRPEFGEGVDADFKLGELKS